LHRKLSCYRWIFRRGVDDRGNPLSDTIEDKPRHDNSLSLLKGKITVPGKEVDLIFSTPIKEIHLSRLADMWVENNSVKISTLVTQLCRIRPCHQHYYPK
jgi:hypothetical protein